jgi:hypothetical protein
VIRRRDEKLPTHLVSRKSTPQMTFNREATILPARIAAFRDVENDARRRTPKLSREIRIVSFDDGNLRRESLEHYETVLVDSEHGLPFEPSE